MKAAILPIVSALTFVVAGMPVRAQENAADHRTASFIEMPAAPGQADAFAEFLADAAPLVKQSEPGTALWFALKAQDTPQDRLAIFDVFVDASARDAHFAGAVAAALKDNADNLVAGGWDRANIRNADVLSTKDATDLYSAKTATFIMIEAAPGQSDQLAALLRAAGPIVAKTEPGTLFWAGLQIDKTTFAIFDIFADEAGRAAHFDGQVAGLLMEKSGDLVRGGWTDGVVANVRNYDILAIK
ncbi:putative quinol monooxygenase [Thalassospira povalilytica]|uniref:Antibiotic biosynthesis monooxygenase n=1 Tax=Thalassospira povalilytica TaxID=732237 RepID=A0A8I1SIY5_9PROT|nr:hypothetical protein [Thalassospira povalilytica]MBN8197797.1 hypothetical protein [Thalassospira povalilytica]